ncbi:MAG: redoxin domain-containing protein [Aureispira sp.]
MNKIFLLLFINFLGVACEDATNTTTPPTAAAVASTAKTPIGKPTTISGDITGIEAGQKLFFDRKTLDATDVVGSVQANPNGAFELTTPITKAGIYRLRIGARPLYILLEGGEKVYLTAQVEAGKIVAHKIEGSLYAEAMQEWQGKVDPNAAKAYLTNSTEKRPLMDLYLVEKLDLVANIELYKKVLGELQEAYPNDLYTKQFNSKVLSMEAKINAQPVAIGRPAPEIDLPNPNGKKIALSSLKGDVVLLDFWASWCRPCRFANPHVVEMYKKYKRKGFNVYNVSLDGLDDRRLAMYQNNEATIQQATELERSKWKQAIKDDKLSWKNHVSELRSWSSSVAALYGVNSIPKTFLLDRKGVIRYQNLRGEQLESAIKTLLAEK